ncbi:MAG: DNA polymerase III, subunit gamma and tau [Desulfobacterales bacterium S7086C20]|nr:MAG: DNA polymerase III, subunit gamma and tau [Desulfobacterales bacterium S7086C20]
MSYLVLARKYRPQTFEQVVGQEHIMQTLKNAIVAERVAHALLFAGPRGIGKTSVARIMAKAMNCEHGPTPSPCNRCQQCKEITKGVSIDVFEIDAASNRGIDEIRELRENTKYMPSQSRYKVYIIDEVHMLSGPAFNALLKTLEEPPSHVLFFLATTEPHKIPITILSRCQRHNLKRIDIENIVKSLGHICRESSFSISETGLRLLGREASGSMRDALSLLDQVMNYADGKVSDEEVLESLGTIAQKVLFDLSAALIGGNAISALDLLDKLYHQGHDLKQIYAKLLEHFRNLLVVKMNDQDGSLIDALEDEIVDMKRQVEKISSETVSQMFAAFFEAEATIKFSAQPKLALEALFIKLTRFDKVISFEDIINKIDNVAKKLETKAGPTEEKSLYAVAEQELYQICEKEESTNVALRYSGNLEQTWQELFPIFNQQCKALVPCLEKAVLTKIGEDFLEISVGGNSFFADRLKEKKSMDAIQEVCRQFFERNMQINIVEIEEEAVVEKKFNRNDKAVQLRKEALNHPVVMDALEIFNGKIVDVKIP